ncbi:unnamed protein product [Fraxinus pennsylvanica]|uniref:Anthranilate synthase n=1 Tax=Fraxinus pennsylvanica TaxID=56036 RepID=A0AAD1ZTK7_9LAMI|nr:unnamed protein product [Fraxinus pennsylvanica]
MQVPTSLLRPSPANHLLSPANHRLSLVTGISIRSSNFSLSLGFRTFQCCSIQSPSSVLDEKRFIEASENGNLIPLCETIFSDQLTPVLAYRCLVKEDDRESPSFLFESVKPGYRTTTVGRYSVVGAQPTMEIVVKENKVTLLDHEAAKMTEWVEEDPMTIPRSISDYWKPQLIEELPDAFCGGWVGFFSYDTVRYLEKKRLSFTSAPKDDRNLADIHLGLYDDVIVFDHVEKLDRFSSAEKAYNDGITRLEKLVSRVKDIDPPRLSPGFIDHHNQHFGLSLKESNMTSEEYKNAVVQAKEHIFAGDIFQIVLSQRFERRTFADPFEIYRALRVVNPSPYMSYLQARGCILVASSPEVLTRINKRKIINRPLAGTIKRGKTALEDEMLEMMLLKDEKQCAEHIMLVDLGRNDVSKVSAYLFYCEKYHEKKNCMLNFDSVFIYSCIVLSSNKISTSSKSSFVLLKISVAVVRLTFFLIQERLKLMAVPCRLGWLVSKSGSVNVEKLMTVERYSHVMHISSTITGELLDHLTCWDALQAALPVGTVSGAPKVKAMQLIDQFEPTRRGPYSGGFGGISFTGDMDIALALRTMIFSTRPRYDTIYSYKDANKRQERVAHIQAGAGIVADSDPHEEHIECERKAAGLVRAIELAESAFVNEKPAKINGALSSRPSASQ